MTCYCTLADARYELKATDTADDIDLFRHIRQVGARINNHMAARRHKPYFAPWLEERSFLLDGDRISSVDNVFTFREPLLAVSTVAVDGHDITAHIGIYPPTSPVYTAFILDYRYAWYDFASNCNSPSYVAINGYWGYHGDWANAWLAVDALAAPMTTGATTFTVADVDGLDPLGFAPRLTPGQLIRLRNEYLEVSAVNTATNVVTVRRAQNGTALPSDSHPAATPVYVYQVEEPIRRVTARQAALLYQRRGAFQQIEIAEVGITSYPQDLLIELMHTLTEYQYT